MIGFAIIQPRVQKALKGIDTCGVTISMVCPACWAVWQLSSLPRMLCLDRKIKGVFVTFIVAWITGLAAGTVVSFIRL